VLQLSPLDGSFGSLARCRALCDFGGLGDLSGEFWNVIRIWKAEGEFGQGLFALQALARQQKRKTQQEKSVVSVFMRSLGCYP